MAQTPQKNIEVFAKFITEICDSRQNEIMREKIVNMALDAYSDFSLKSAELTRKLEGMQDKFSIEEYDTMLKELVKSFEELRFFAKIEQVNFTELNRKGVQTEQIMY